VVSFLGLNKVMLLFFRKTKKNLIGILLISFYEQGRGATPFYSLIYEIFLKEK